MVAERRPGVVGVKVTATTHDALGVRKSTPGPAPSVQLLVWVYSPAGMTLIVRLPVSTEPLLVTVKFWVTAESPIRVNGKLMIDGFTESAAFEMPLPERPALAGPPVPVTSRVATLAPAVAGEKVTVTVQLSPAVPAAVS